MENIKQNEVEKNMINMLVEKTQHMQMTAKEYEYICSFLGDKNFLVFGTGYDSNLWRYANSKGKTIFLENIGKWINPQDTDVYKVTYSTKRGQYKELLEDFQKGEYGKLQMELPNIVRTTAWDCIFVDSPVGTTDKKPGRMQSIFAARQLSSRDTNVFVHDIDRDVENEYTRKMFSSIIKELTKLRHVKI